MTGLNIDRAKGKPMEHFAEFYERGSWWTRWRGGEEAPADWNGGRVLLAEGTILHPYQTDEDFDWTHDVSESGCIEPGCIVGYNPEGNFL